MHSDAATLPTPQIPARPIAPERGLPVSLVYLLPTGSLATVLGGTDNGLFASMANSGVISRGSSVQ
jgi:hypothetical protein